MNARPPRRRRARPVADAPVHALLAREEDLAKGWLLALLEDVPLDAAPAILAGDLPREGPRICGAVVRALADDDDLRRLDSGGALEPLVARTGELAGARDVETAIRAVEALQSVIWSALREELSYPDTDQVSELAERLALAIELVRVAALRRSTGPVGPSVRRVAVADADTERPTVAEPGSEQALDEDSAQTADDAAQGGEDSAQRGPAIEEPAAAARDPRALWLSALEDEIVRAVRSGVPLSLLLAELDDAERVLAVEPQSQASATFGRFAQAVRGAVRRQDILACETDTRAWIIARDTARPGAQALGARIAGAVGEAGGWRGAPLRVSVGVAILGEDGQDSMSLVEAAEEATFAAAASGIGIVRATPSGAPDDDGPRLVS